MQTWWFMLCLVIVSHNLKIKPSMWLLPFSLLWLNEERRHMQISTEIMIPWKILRRWGRLVFFRVQSDLEYKGNMVIWSYCLKIFTCGNIHKIYSLNYVQLHIVKYLYIVAQLILGTLHVANGYPFCTHWIFSPSPAVTTLLSRYLVWSGIMAYFI